MKAQDHQGPEVRQGPSRSGRMQDKKAVITMARGSDCVPLISKCSKTQWSPTFRPTTTLRNKRERVTIAHMYAGQGEGYGSVNATAWILRGLVVFG